MCNNDDLYLEAGKILELIQLWEEKFKLLTIKFNISESNDKRSLSNMNSFLLRNNIINNDEYLCIKKIIELRNFIIHRLFLEINTLNLLIVKEQLDLINTSINESLLIFQKK